MVVRGIDQRRADAEALAQELSAVVRAVVMGRAAAVYDAGVAELAAHGDPAAMQVAMVEKFLDELDVALGEGLGADVGTIREAAEEVFRAVAEHLAGGVMNGAERELVVAGVVVPLLVAEPGCRRAVRAAVG